MLALLIVLFILVVVGVFVASFFVKRYRESDRPAAGWQPTDEIFNDPSTNRVMRVWIDGGGNRHYVAEGQHPTA